MKAAPVTSETREMTRAAAQWLALLDCDEFSEADLARLQNWRNSHPGHERAWQRALLLRQRFSGLPPELAMASLDRPDLGRRRALKQALGVAVVLPAAWLLGRQLPVEVWRADLHTGTGDQQQLTLADGSLLQLNTDSAVDLDLQANQLRLVRGEIALKVPGSSALSLLLPYGRALVRQSEVCVRLDDQHCRVSVVSGSVQVLSSVGAAQVIKQGQQLSLQRSGFGAVQPFDPSLPDWREGVLMAQDQPLGDFLRELSRYRPGLLRWDPALERLRVTGSFRLNDTDRVLALLAASLPLAVQSRTRYWVTLVPREKTA
tara:strand:- start:182 stop:1132 length:951 start_codon:yes stop_codon:yes gene_type:complete